MIITWSLYSSIVQRLQLILKSGGDLSLLEDEWYDKMEYNSIFSLFSQLWVRRIKYEIRSFNSSRMTNIIYTVINNQKTLYEISVELGFSSYKLAKLFTEQYFGNNFQLSRLIENPSIVENIKLRKDLLQCISKDPLNSNEKENLKSCVGREFEELLQNYLDKKHICYETEMELRAKGKPRTPDALLLIPMAVKVKANKRYTADSNTTTTNNNTINVKNSGSNSSDNDGYHIVNWIDSKGMFADLDTFREHGEQLAGYVNRYGAGLVIYWYGFVEGLQNLSGDNILVLNEFPDEWIFPTGEVANGTPPAFDDISIN